MSVRIMHFEKSHPSDLAGRSNHPSDPPPPPDILAHPEDCSPETIAMFVELTMCKVDEYDEVVFVGDECDERDAGQGYDFMRQVSFCGALRSTIRNLVQTSATTHQLAHALQLLSMIVLNNAAPDDGDDDGPTPTAT